MMTSRSSRTAWLALALAATLAGCATAPAESPASTTGLAQVDSVLRGADTSLPVQLSVQPSQVRIGDPVRLLVNAAGPGYLYLYQVGTGGQRVVQVFPNAVDGANYSAGGPVMLPRPGWQIRSGGPAGQGYFVAVLAPSPMDLNVIASEAAQGRIALPARYGAAMGSLREVAP